MKPFLDIVDSNILILDKSLNIIFCNKKLLQNLKCNNSEINNLKLNTSGKEKKCIEKMFSSINKGEAIDLNIKINNHNRTIELESKVISGKFYDEESIFISAKVIKIISYKEEIESNALEENLKEEISSTQKSIDTLNYILNQMEEDKDLNKHFRNKNLYNDIEQVLREINKNELLTKDFQIFLGMSVDLIGSMDNRGTLKVTNQQWTNYLGWKQEELLGTNVVDLIEANYKEELIKIINSKDEQIHVIENKIKCKDKSYKWLRWNIKHVKEAKCFAITIRDISKDKEQEIKRKKLEKAIQLESIKNEFFANMSHEFKTPLNIILGTMQLLDMNLTNNNIIWNENIDLNKYVKLIKQNSYRLLKLINNLIDMTKIENGYYEVNLDNYNIVNVVEDITLSVVQYANTKGINLIFDTNIEEKVIACDPEKIERILLNLLSNSIKHTNIDGKIKVKVEVNEEKIYISVTDNGDGISKEKLPIIFNRYVQGNNTLTKKCEGSGIGLALVKSLLQMHNGDINVVSEEGVGSEFKFYLPNITIESKRNDIQNIGIANNKIEMCNIEFSDIYGI
ncbi:MAG: ATP-binding protein [Peptostreptococcaceae bacterium]